MPAPQPYLHFPGTAREAITFYAEVFGGDAQIHDFQAFGRDDGPRDSVAHGILTGPVELYCADVGRGDKPFEAKGLLFSLLGAADPNTLERWFAELSVGGIVVEPLRLREWGAHDGQVIDRFGIPWLIGYEVE